MTQIIGGHNLGLFDGSYSLLNRNDQSRQGTIGHGVETFGNVANGNLLLQEQDVYLPSLGEDFSLVRTYNSRGAVGMDPGWSFSTLVTLSKHTETSAAGFADPTSYSVTYGDGSELHFAYDAGRKLWVSTDGAGAYETLQVIPKSGKTDIQYLVTRADGSQYLFDKDFKLASITDTNGVKTSFEYKANELAVVRDDTGHTLSFAYSGGRLISVTDETTKVLVSYAYTNGLLTQVTDRFGHVTTYVYNKDRLLESITLPSEQTVDGKTTTYETRQVKFSYTKIKWDDHPHYAEAFDQGDQFVLTQVTDAAGGVTKFAYDFRFAATVDAADRDTPYKPAGARFFTGGTTTVTDALGVAVKYEYDANGQLTKVTDAKGFETSYAYDFTGNLLSIKDGNGATSSFTYDGNGNMLTSRDGVGNVTTYTYTTTNQVATITTALGHTTTFEYDAKQNLVKRVDALGNIVRWAYDADGNLTTKTVFLDKNDLTTPSKQQVTTYAYDVFGNNVRIVDGENNTTTQEFDHFGNRVLVTDARGGKTNFVYDADNRLLATTDALGRTTSYAYDAVGNQIAVTNVDGRTITRVYDRNNLLLATIDPAANASFTRETRYQYDVVGNNTQVTDAEGRTTTYTFDANRRVIDVKAPEVKDVNGNPVSYHERYAYDGVGNVVTKTDRNGSVTQFQFTATRQIATRVDADGNTTRFTYDADLRQVEIIVGAQLVAEQRRVLKFAYDTEDQLVEEKDALGNTKTYGYDAAGNVVAVTDANGKTTNFEFDRNNRLVKQIRPAVDVNGTPTRTTVVHQYDANGNQVAITDENGHRVTMAYDAVDRQVLITDANGVDTVFTYDRRDNRTMVAVGVNADFGNGQLVVTNTGTERVTTYQFDEFDQLIATTDGVGHALVSSDEAVYQKWRSELGYNVESASSLSEAQRNELLEKFTEHYTYDKVGNQTTIVDHLDRTRELSYDGLDRLVSVTEVLGTGVTRTTTYRYDGNDNVVATKLTAAGGFERATTMAYDAMNRLVESTDAAGMKTSYAYDNVGNLTSRTLAVGTDDARKTSYVYDLANRLSSETNPALDKVEYSYDAVGNRLEMKDARGGVTEYVYDARNRAIKVIDPLDFETRFVYDGVGNTLQIVDARGGITKFSYDAGDRRIAIEDAEHRKTTFEYDRLDNSIRQTTAAGTAIAQQTTYVYDAEGNLHKVTDAAGNTTTATFDALYNETSAKDGNGHVTTYAFDALNRRISVTDPVGTVTTFSYDAADNVLTETTSGADITTRTRTYAYDAADRVITVDDALGKRTTYAYDKVGNEVSISRLGDATTATRTTTYQYDLADRLTKETDALGHVTTYAYDGNGNVTKVTDARNNATTYAYDANNRVVTITDAAAGVTTYAYDGNGNRTQVVDARGNAGVTYYNANNEVLLTVDATGAISTYKYDANGNVVERTDYRNRLTLPVNSAVVPTPSGPSRTFKFSYDALNRIVGQENPEGGASRIAYDAVGNRIRETDENGHAVTYAYDAADRLIARLTAEGYLTTFAYDAVGNEVKRSAYRNVYVLGADGKIPAPNGSDTPRVTTATWDLNNRILSRTDTGGLTTAFTYDAVGNLTKTVMGSGAAAREATTAYDLADRVTDTTDAAGTRTHYVFDDAGNIIARQDAYDGTTAQRTTKYTYDELNRVASMTDALGHVTTYAYDKNGNLVTRTLNYATEAASGTWAANPSGQQRVEKFEYDAENRVAAQVNGAGERTVFAYDAFGNRTKVTVAPGHTEQRINEFEYDGNDRLVAEIDGNGIRTEYRFDAAGNIVEVIQASGVSGQERHTRMTYSADDRLLTVTSPRGATTTSNTTDYTTTYRYDDLGNRVEIVDAVGTVTRNTFDVRGRLVENIVGFSADPTKPGIKTVNTYDDFGNVLSTTRSFADGGDARTTTYAYDKLDRQIQVIDGEGFASIFDYDVFGNLTHVRRGAYTGSDSAKQAAAHPLDSWFTYDKLDQLLTTVAGPSLTQGSATANAYDGLGNRITQKTGIALGGGIGHESTLSFSYDAAGRVIERTTATGGVTRLAYDQAGNQVERRVLQSGAADATGTWTVETYQYDGNGRVIAKLDSYAVKTQFTYDAVGNQTGVVFAKGTADERSVGYRYDLDNNKIADIDGLGNETTYGYDAVGNLVTQTDALGRTTRFYYDAFHRVVGKLDARHFYTHMQRDSAGNITETRVYMNAIVNLDDASAPSPISSGSDRVIGADFDRASRLVKLTSPDGSYKTFKWDSTGKQVEQTQHGSTDATLQARTQNTAARVRSWAYDDAGRLTTFTDVDGVTETYTYDAANNKISETIHNPNRLAGGRSDPDRTTTFEYDLDNRLVKQVFDPKDGNHPNGLDLEQTLAYDKAGNVVAKTDANDHTTTSVYDRENRVVKVIDPLGQVPGALGHFITYAYDRVGNLVTATNANGATVTTEYDDNNRAIREVRAAVSVRHWVNGLLTTATVTPTTTKTYDKVGNVIQIEDARGYVTTRWYDASNNVIGEQNGDGALRRFSYDALGQLLTVTQDMVFKGEPPAGGADLAAFLAAPPAPSADVRTVSNQYDLAGHVVKTTYSSITVTTLANTDGASPTKTTGTVTPEESNYYDAFGNLVESVDRNGNHSYAYYDLRGRQVATVDAAGYLVETAFDAQDHVVQQAKYTTRIAGSFNDAGRLTSGTAATRPTAPAGAVTVDRIYDAAGRLLEEWSPPAKTTAGDIRVVTRYAYDAVGNLASKTLNYATIDSAGTRTETAASARRTEYYWYDAAGRRVAIVGADRVLAEFSFDGVGNVTTQTRHFDAVDIGVNLATVSLTTVKANVTADAARDQATAYEYDAANRLVKRTDLMGAGTDDDIVNVSGYDETGNLTYRKDPDNFETKTRYDSAAHAVEVLAPNGSRSFIEYDTGGLKVRAYTGGASGNLAPPAQDVAASATNGPNGAVVITWDQPGSNVTSWVAWDTVSHGAAAVPSVAPGLAGGGNGSYAHASAAAGAGEGLAMALAGVPSGKIYFRIVTKDAAGNLTWTEEKSATVPPRLRTASIAASSSGFTLTISFDTAVTAASLKLNGGAGTTWSGTASNGGKTWTINFTGTKADPFQIQWTHNDSGTSVAYTTTNVALLAASGSHVDTGNGWLTWPLPSDGVAAVGNGQYLLVNGMLQADKDYQGSVNGVAVTADTSVRVNNAELNVLVPTLANGASAQYDALYGTLSGETHSAAIAFTQRQTATVVFDHYNTHQDNGNTVYDSTTYNVVWANDALKTNVDATFQQAEADRIGAGGVKVSYRAAQNGTAGFTDVAASASGLAYSAALTLTPGSTYDVKVWYTDKNGREVIVEWRRVTVPANAVVPATTQVTTAGKDNAPAAPGATTASLGTTNYTGDRSLAILARETGGTIAKAADKLTVTVGTYTGPVNPAGSSVTLTLGAAIAGDDGGQKTTDGLLSKTYYTEIQYNALGVKIASNEDSGQWRRYGVDANGNVVETAVYGTQDAEAQGLAAIRTYEQFDARDLEIASWAIDPDGTGSAQSAVTRTGYDYAKRTVSVQDPGSSSAQARELAYDGAGNLIQTTDALDNTTRMAYNAFGQLVATTDAEDNIRRKQYDQAGRLVEESIDGISDKRFYTYDAFGRRISSSRGISGNATTYTYTYDQRDRVTSVTDGAAGATNYFYDKRDNRTWTQDANGHWFGRTYDAAGMVTHEYSFVTRWTDDSGDHTANAPTTLAQALDAVANSVSPYRAGLRDEATTYDIFGNKLSVTDAAGRHQYFSYGAFGRLLSVSTDGAPSAWLSFVDGAGVALVTNYTYDRFGNKTGETSNYGKAISYTVDAAGRVTMVNDTATGTKTTFSYDVAGRRATETLERAGTIEHHYSYTYNANGWMTAWSDASTGIGEANTYDDVGNVTRVVGKTSGNATYFTHDYSYDNANRVLTAGDNTYTYDVRGRRASWASGGTTVNYTYDNADRVTQASGSDGKSLWWTYDKVGNVTSVKNDAAITFTTDATIGDITGVASGAAKDRHYTFYRYDANNASWYSQSDAGSDEHGDGYSGSTTKADKAGRTVKLVVSDGGNPGDVKTYTYSHTYNADGTEHSVAASGSGDVTGSSTSTYDVNRQLTNVNLGRGDSEDQSRDETKAFSYDNAGHIVKATHDTGKSDATTKNYLYAYDMPAGEYTDAAAPTLDSGNYSVIQNVPAVWGDSGPKFPDGTVSEHVVAAGETLQSIASSVYGHPELWFVIAEANGLTGAEQLSSGMRLSIPNSTQYAGFDMQTHTVYKEGDIVGSKLPNLKSPPPPDNTCAVVAAIILIVIVAIVAVVVTVLTVGAAAPAAAAALGVTATSAAGILVGVAVGAVIGAAVAFTASVITQGILIGFGLQQEFDWKQVAADTVAGAISGAAGGLGAMIEAANAASVAIKVVNVVGQAVLEATSDLGRQLIENDGRIDQVNWITVGVSGGAGALGAVAAVGVRTTKASEKAAVDAVQQIDDIAELQKIAGKTSLLKNSGLEVGDTVLKTSRFKFKVVQDASDGGLIIKRFERMTALPQIKIFDDAGKLTDVVLDNDVTTASQRFSKVFKQKWLDQTHALRTAFRGRSLEQVIDTGTVSGSKVGNFKTVRKYVATVDDATGLVKYVARDQKVIRESVLGTSRMAKMSQFFETTFASSAKVSDRIKEVKEVREIAVALQEGGETIRGTQRMVMAKEVVRTSWTKKLAETETVAKLAKTKIVKGFKEVVRADGTIEMASTFTEVARKSAQGTRFARFGKWAKESAEAASAAISSGASAAVDGIGAGWQAAKTGVAEGAQWVGGKAVNFLKKRAADPNGWEKFYIGTLGGGVLTASTILYKNFGTSDADRKHLSNAASPYQFSKGGGNFMRSLMPAAGVLELGPVAAGVFFKVWPKRVVGTPQNAGPFAVASHAERSVGKDAYFGRNAAEAFAATHDRSNIWVPTSWATAASGAASQIYSPFDFDHGNGLATALQQNRLVAGETGRFDARSVVAMTAATAGRVGTNPIPQPIMFLSNQSAVPVR